ncbi:MAG: deoxyribonuclease IV [Treponema sp.]|nr:deoxyribonuclease IV [Treponema sp.]
MFNIGWHLSASGGLLAMGKTALSAGASTFAFFTRNPRGGQAKPIDKDDAAALNAFLKEHNFAPLVVHAPYTLNACSDKESVRDFAKIAFTEDLVRMEETPNQLYNFHPGSHMKQGIETGIKMISSLLNEIIQDGQTTTILLETMAGKGSEVGSSFEELKSIIDSVEKSDRLGICFDTCHTYDAGYDIVNDLDGVLTEFDKIIGLSRIKAVHLNDSKNPFKSHKDRHEKIGQGSLGIESFKRIINHEALRDLPFILETPNETVEEYAQEIKLLKDLRVS